MKNTLVRVLGYTVDVLVGSGWLWLYIALSVHTFPNQELYRILRTVVLATIPGVLNIGVSRLIDEKRQKGQVILALVFCAIGTVTFLSEKVALRYWLDWKNSHYLELAVTVCVICAVPFIRLYLIRMDQSSKNDAIQL